MYLYRKHRTRTRQHILAASDQGYDYSVNQWHGRMWFEMGTDEHQYQIHMTQAEARRLAQILVSMADEADVQGARWAESQAFADKVLEAMREA